MNKPNKIPRNERKCKLCNSLEDEFHFIIECPLYHDYRVNKYMFLEKDNYLEVYRIKAVKQCQNNEKLVYIFVQKF